MASSHKNGMGCRNQTFKKGGPPGQSTVGLASSRGTRSVFSPGVTSKDNEGFPLGSLCTHDGQDE